MNADSTKTPSLPPIASREAFARAVHRALERAADEGVRELCWSDPDFVDWPLNEPALLATLQRWAGPKRQLLMVAHEFDALARTHARFVAWRRLWAHVIVCRAAPELPRGEVPSLLLGSAGASLQRLDAAHGRGRWLTTEDELRTWREVIDAVLQRSEDAFPAHTLGL
jgi:hypothetical protein